MKTTFLWDLDGTLTDPGQGIIRCYQYALESFGLPVPQHEELRWVVGPPLHASFPHFLPEADEARVWGLVEKYRERFAEIGMYENEVFKGIPEALAAVSQHANFVATSKPHVFASKIISHFGLERFFKAVYGAELDGVRSEKGDLIAYLLEQEGVAPGEAVMVGDRKHDIIGAKKAGLASIGITWGYGSVEELSAAGADYICATPDELVERLRLLSKA